MDQFELIRFVSIFSVSAPIIFYCVKFKSNPIQNHLIGAFLLICAVFDILLAMQIWSVPLLSNVQDVFQFSILTWFYYELVYKKKSELLMLISIGVYVSFLLAYVFQYGFHSNFTGLWSVGSIIIAVHAIVYPFTLPQIVLDRYFDSNLFSNLIINASLLCYFSMSILMFILADKVFTSEPAHTIDAFWTLHNIFNIIKNIGLALGFYYTGKRKIYMTMQQLEKIARKLEEEKVM